MSENGKPLRIQLIGVDWDERLPTTQIAANCGGIVIEAGDAHRVAYLPGFVTRLDMRIYKYKGE